jgi:uncharacterized membrane protein YphA (DoxX/SURF4 family)
LQIIITGIIFILHGLVHLLYAGQSRRIFELQPGMIWPDGSWVFSKLLSAETIRLLATVLLLLAAFGFIAGGLGLLIRQDWWRFVISSAAIFSSLIFIILWDGKFQAMDEKGGVGLLINLVILIIVLVLKWSI